MAPPTPRRTKVYRFALFGRRNAGKTCILAALAMERLPNPKQFACIWIDRPGPNLLASLRAADPGAADGFTLGKQWLDRAIEQLGHCDVPPPNPNESEAYRFLFQFTTPDHRTFLVEMIDYSGELIDSNLTDTELAKRLRQHMLATDAILVLAEVPRKGEEGKELVEELARLKRAFAALHGERQTGPAPESPVVLALNKWDRRQTREEFLRDEELSGGDAHLTKQGVRELLGGTSDLPYRGLVDTLHGSVADGRFKVFPLSAFGEPAPPEPEKRPDRPNRVNPLHSFGLEDGFVWACRQRDAIDLDNLEREVGGKKPWTFWRAFWPSAWRSHRDIVERFPVGTPERDRAGAACQRSRAMALIQSLAGVILLAILVQLSFFAADAATYRQHRSTLAMPTGANEEQLRSAEEWLGGYNGGSAFRHSAYRIVFDSGEAGAKLNDLRQEKNRQRVVYLEKRRKEIADEPDEVIRVQAAKRLLEELRPDDPEEYKAWCVGEIEKWIASIKIRENEEALRKIEVAFQTLIAESSEDREAYRKLLRETVYLPKHKEFESKPLARQRLDLVDKINGRLVKLIEIESERIVRAALAKLTELKKQSQAAEGNSDELQKCLTAIREEKKRLEPIATPEVIDKYQALIGETELQHTKAKRDEDFKIFKEKYEKKLRGGEIAEAAEDLIARGRGMKEIDDLRKEFPGKAQQKINEKTTEWIKDGKWPSARQKLGEWSTDKNIKSLVDETLRRWIEDQIVTINAAEDQDLYDKVRDPKTRSEAAYKSYLVHGPICAMKSQVEAHRDWTAKMAGHVDFKIEVTVLWGEKCHNNYENNVNVKIDGHDLVDEKKVKSTRGGTSQFEPVDRNRKLNQQVIFGADIVVTDGTFIVENRAHGSSRDQVFPVSDMLGEGKVIELDKFNNRIKLRIKESSLPQEPPLPGWSK